MRRCRILFHCKELLEQRLDELAESKEDLPTKLSPEASKAKDVAKVKMDEKTFRDLALRREVRRRIDRARLDIRILSEEMDVDRRDSVV